MCDQINKALQNRNEFITHLQSDIKQNENIYSEAAKELENLQITCKSVKELGNYPEHKALIPLGKNIYMNGRIIHTGEYYIRKKAYPESYFCLQTLDQTVDSLEIRIEEQEKIMKTAEYANKQLVERLHIVQGNDSEEIADTNNMPKEIRSEKGVALKVGDFYEILEFED